MVAAQHMESQVALYLIVSLPPPKDGLLSSFFPLLLICLKLQIKCVSFVLKCILISLAFSHCILLCPISCQFVVPAKHNIKTKFQVNLIFKNTSELTWMMWQVITLLYTHLSLSALYVCAISGTNGSSGFGSQRREQIDNNTVEE